jgi:hypothetical protein
MYTSVGRPELTLKRFLNFYVVTTCYRWKVFRVALSWCSKNGRQNVAIDRISYLEGFKEKRSGDSGGCRLLVLCNIGVV